MRGTGAGTGLDSALTQLLGPIFPRSKFSNSLHHTQLQNVRQRNQRYSGQWHGQCMSRSISAENEGWRTNCTPRAPPHGTILTRLLKTSFPMSAASRSLSQLCEVRLYGSVPKNPQTDQNQRESSLLTRTSPLRPKLQCLCPIVPPSTDRRPLAN